MGGSASSPAYVTVFEAVPRRAGGDVVVALRGELDLAGVPRFLHAMSVVGDVPGVGVVLDLSELTFIDASGIRAIERARDGLYERGVDLIVRSPQPAVRRVLGLCGLELPVEAPRALELEPAAAM